MNSKLRFYFIAIITNLQSSDSRTCQQHKQAIDKKLLSRRQTEIISKYVDTVRVEQHESVHTHTYTVIIGGRF